MNVCCRAAILLAWTFAATAHGQPASEVAATVGQEPVRIAEVDRLAAIATRGQSVADWAMPVMRAQVLEEIVARRLVLAYARRTGAAATEAEIRSALDALQQDLASRQKTLDQYLQEQSVTADDLRRQLAWNIVWERYLARYVIEERLEAHFAAHRRQFDGTEMLVSHILFQLERDATAQDLVPLVEKAEQIRDEIVAGKLSFAEAAQKYSGGPSAAEGGRLGWIGRRGPMVEAFSRAAFTLRAGEISPPVVTPFGVHLIRCDEIKPGTRQLADVRRAVEDSLARELLERLSALERPHTPVEYTGAVPYFKAGTRELVGEK